MRRSVKTDRSVPGTSDQWSALVTAKSTRARKMGEPRPPRHPGTQRAELQSPAAALAERSDDGQVEGVAAGDVRLLRQATGPQNDHEMPNEGSTPSQVSGVGS